MIQTYQRGHKAVMNTHTVGGNSERTKFVGMDEYGNKYYEDFTPLCTQPPMQTRPRGGGSSSTTTSQ